MGLSASQARLLSITRRISNNELKSQILSNSKIRLADDSAAASRKYIKALDSKKLNYKVYKDSGSVETIALTFNALSNYSPLKTQYAVVNGNGQIYISAEDAKIFEKSNNLFEFLSAYGLATEATEGGFTFSDENKAQWYTNLWFKMNEQSQVGIVYSGIEDESVSFMKDLRSFEKQATDGYVVMDDIMGSSTSWLKFALENGLVNLTRVEVEKDTIKNVNSWNSIEYTSASDIVEIDDTSQVQKAEIEYQQATRQIQAEDKKIDNDIKKLDTEHSTLKSEYDSVKNVMSKNIERSFTTFS